MGGGEIVLLPKFEAGEALAAITRRRCTDLCGVPAMFQAMIEHPASAKTDYSTVLHAFSGGAAMLPALKLRFEAATGARLLEGYGMTESAGVVSVNPYEGEARAGTVGHPLPGTSVILIDEQGERVPPGAKGEIAVSGPQVMLGYWRADQARIEPLDGGLFRTGDVGTIDPEGYLRIVDRIKDMINVGGFKVFPSQLEAVLSAHPAVGEVLVIRIPDKRVGERPKAFVVLRDGAEVMVTGPHPFAPVVGAVIVRSAAIDAGLQVGDVVLKAGGQDVLTFAQLPKIIAASKGAPVPLTIWRAGKTFDLTLTPRIRTVEDATGAMIERYQIGIGAGLFFEAAMRSPGPFETVTLTLERMWQMTVSTFSGLWHILIGAISTCNLSGAIGMAEAVGDAARTGAETFFGMMAVLSLGVGILNLFPIPVLDGGHLVFHAYEAVMRRPPSAGALRLLMSVGLSIVLGFMIYALSRDLVCV